jgi:hypothetical protein
MFNLVEVQTALQNPSVQLADLMKYANGSSAEVPAYLALGELNRRKQLEATKTAFNATPPTVKDQLTNAPPAVNPTAAPTGIAPTGAPQLASAVAAPPRMNVAAAPANQVNPVAIPQMAAEGGLMSIPTPHMFHPESYATGGIVAFSGKDDSFVEPNAYQKEMQDKMEKLKLSPEQEARKDELNAIKYLDEAKAAKDKKEIENWKGAAERGSATENELRAQRQAVEEKPAKDKQIADKMVADAAARDELMAARQAQQKIDEEAQTKKLRDTDEANAALMRPKPDVKQQGGIPDALKPATVATVAPVAPVAPAAAPTGIAPSANAEMTPAERHARLLKQMEYAKEERTAAGISDDPHKADRESLDALEASRAGQKSAEGRREIAQSLIALSQQDPLKGFGVAMGAGADASAKLSKESAALHDKQAVEMIAARQAMATADDARKRGDLATAKAAEESAEKHTEKFKELGIQRQQADASTTQADAAALHAGSEAAYKGMDEETKRIVANAAMHHALNPELTEGQRKANAIKDIMRLKKVDLLQATKLYSIAENAGKLEGLDDKALAARIAKWDTLTHTQKRPYLDKVPNGDKMSKTDRESAAFELYRDLQRGTPEVGIPTVATPTVATPTARKAPTQAHVDFLMKNPSASAEFDGKFGKGSAATYLGRNTAIPIQDVQRQKEQY